MIDLACCQTASPSCSQFFSYSPTSLVLSSFLFFLIILIIHNYLSYYSYIIHITGIIIHPQTPHCGNNKWRPTSRRLHLITSAWPWRRASPSPPSPARATAAVRRGCRKPPKASAFRRWVTVSTSAFTSALACTSRCSTSAWPLEAAISVGVAPVSALALSTAALAVHEQPLQHVGAAALRRHPSGRCAAVGQACCALVQSPPSPG
jgi:hypothetical protein